MNDMQNVHTTYNTHKYTTIYSYHGSFWHLSHKQAPTDQIHDGSNETETHTDAGHTQHPPVARIATVFVDSGRDGRQAHGGKDRQRHPNGKAFRGHVQIQIHFDSSCHDDMLWMYVSVRKVGYPREESTV
jgi:hypothetical protein